MNPSNNNRAARPSKQYRTINRSDRQSENRATHMHRRAVALGAVALVAIFGPKFVSTEYHAITSTTTADNLQKPFDKVDAEFKAGKFSPGTVKEVTLPAVDQSAYQDALAMTGQGAAESNIDEAYNDIKAQQGDTPQAFTGDLQVVLPTNDLRPGLQK